MFRSSLVQVVNFRSGGKSDDRKNWEKKKMFLKSTYSFFLLSFMVRKWNKQKSSVSS